MKRHPYDTAVLISGILLTNLCFAGLACAAECSFETQGEGRVVEIIDNRTFRLQDGREIRLSGIEIPAEQDAATKATRMAVLTSLLGGRDVILRGPDDTPGRYGRQPAFVFLENGNASVQGELLSHGDALVSSLVEDRDCAAALMATEAKARQAGLGIWSHPDTIVRAERGGDILAAIGRFTLIEGKVLSVRQSGTTTYLNFGRNWTRDFAVTISKRIMGIFEAAGMPPKSLENRRIRVRGWVEARRGPRIEVLRVGQIELLGEN